MNHINSLTKTVAGGVGVVTTLAGVASLFSLPYGESNMKVYKGAGECSAGLGLIYLHDYLGRKESQTSQTD